MSLTVSVYQRAADGTRQRVELAPGADLAGFERWRINVWGSRHVRALGLRILPDLDRRDLSVSGAELDALAAEVELLGGRLREVAAQIAAEGDVVSNGDPYETIRARLDNITAAIAVARSVPEGELVIS
jgi:hypothetical protein